MSGLSPQQIGKVAERLFYKLAVLGSGGKLEAYMPVADEESRDFEVHIKGKYRPILAIQVKCVTALWYRKGTTVPRLAISFVVRKDHTLTDELFWYFFAFLDVKAMAFMDPLFVIPSTEVNKYVRARKGRNGDYFEIGFLASMDPQSRDRWSRYQVPAEDLGKRLLQILRDSSGVRMPAA
jgi:hypothetical protein